MPKKNSTPPPRRKTPYPLPRPDFPLSPHVPTNRWYKTVRGRRHYFGPLTDPDGALDRWLAVRDHLLAGRTPPASVSGGGLTLRELANRWMTAREGDMRTGELTPRSFDDYRLILEHALKVLDRSMLVSMVRPDDFRRLVLGIRKATKSPTSQTKRIAVVKMMFRWAWENELIDKPVNFGSDFKVGRRARAAADAAAGKRIFTAEDVRRLIDAAGVPLKAMILLGINGGYTQKEVAGLRIAEVNLDDAIIDHQRDKTGIERTVSLWPETIKAVRDALDARPNPKAADAKPLLFVTRQGRPWHREVTAAKTDGGKGPVVLHRFDSVNLEFGKLLKKMGVKVEGAGFGKLRATHRTASDGANDLNAALRIMGHKVPGISRHYVKSIDRQRLVVVSEYVRRWLWPDLDKSVE